tara:strand:+ start:731 stop:1240 length:510 start_codon:yes stop_codon:yes gene_type:complete
MVSLTHIMAAPHKDRTPLMVEVPVAPEVSPYLVTSSKSVTWVNRAHGNGCVRAAVREVGPDILFRELVEAVVLRSKEEGWGNVAPPTAEGFKTASDYLSYYGFQQVELLGSTLKLAGVKTKETPWVPAGWGVVIPADRDFVGTTLDFGKGRVASVIHNAARGIVVLCPQ